MSMFGPKPGVWWIKSKTDPRWDCHGEAAVGGFAIPREAQDKLEELKKTLGEPPEDTEWGYEKY